MKKKKQRYDGRSSDIQCLWFTATYGNQWEKWRSYAERWLSQQDLSLNTHRNAITWFLESYLIKLGMESNPDFLFLAKHAHPDLFLELRDTVAVNGAAARNNKIVYFIDWVIAEDYSEPNDYNVPVPQVKNPFSLKNGTIGATESVRSALPYRYIKELRSIICPNPKGHYRDWLWAQNQTGQERSNGWKANLLGDWFEVDPATIDKNDPDCVWRMRTSRTGNRYEIWSPVKAMVIYIKLQLPLRTYQVRMLDSGEADHLRYHQGRWLENTIHNMATQLGRRQKGVFRRIVSAEIGEVMTGIYVSTNKTADQNKDEIDRGYVIPWQHEQVLYWLEKLRNWQEKYNAINQPAQCIDLKKKHLGGLKSNAALTEMGSFCFLMRDASARSSDDRDKPIQDNSLGRIWYLLLQELEQRVESRGEKLKDSSPLRFVESYDEGYTESLKVKTKFPLHSLRVSLLTCYAFEGSVPAPVLSKLLAGHSRIVMTLYYLKITPSTMKSLMLTAEEKIEANEDESFRRFLKDMEMEEIVAITAFNDDRSVNSALVNRNPVGWEQRHIGLCLVGGNSSRSDESGKIGGCWNGGELMADKKDPRSRIYGPVPNGPENCCRCRWFITEARHLDSLRAHFNNLSYQAQNAANLAIEHEQTVEELEDQRLFSIQKNIPFTKKGELLQAERRADKQKVLANEYANDMNATFRLITRLIDIEEKRDHSDVRQKLVAVGNLGDISTPLNLIETASELWQLAVICEDAEVYPEEADELLKTPAVLKRSEQLNIALMRDGYAPVFLNMDDKMKLIAGNAMLRAMAKKVNPEDWRVDGLKQVTGHIELGKSLMEQGLLTEAVRGIESELDRPMLMLEDVIRKSQSNKGIVHA